MNKARDDDSHSNNEVPYIDGGTGQLASTTNRAKLSVPEVEIQTIAKKSIMNRSRMQNNSALNLQALTNATAIKNSMNQRPSSRQKKNSDTLNSQRGEKPYQRKK